MDNELKKEIKNIVKMVAMNLLFTLMLSVLEVIVFNEYKQEVEGLEGIILFSVFFLANLMICFPLSTMLYFVEKMYYGMMAVRKNTEEIYNISYENYSVNYDIKSKVSEPVGQITHPTYVNNESNPVNAVHSSSNTSISGWRCMTCDTNNDETARFCRICGKSR